jgi:hypothetical protein
VDGAVWHIAVGDGTQGPYTLDELREYYAQGSVMLDTLVFRDGFEEWLPAGEVPELAAPSQAQSHTQAGALAFAGGVSMGSDPFGERRPELHKSPRVSASEMLDENVSREHTVQFSLDQIRALSSASQPMQAAPVVSMPRTNTIPGTSGYASGDGSGLIDVRKLAEMHAAMTAQESPRAEIETSSLIPSHSSYAHTLAPLSLPLPSSAAPNGSIDSKTKLIAGLAAFGMVLTAAVGVLALMRPAPPTELAATAQPPAEHVVNSQPSEEPRVAAAEAEEEEEAKPEELAKADKEEAEADKEEASADDDGDSQTASRSTGKRNKRSKGKSKSDDEDSEPVAKADKKADKKDKEKPSAKESIDDLLAGGPSKSSKGSSASSSIDDLLDNAVSGKKSAPKAEPKPADSGLPQTPSRDAMLASLGKAKAKAAKCKGPGVATAAIQVAGTGKVSSVSVTGAEGAAAACVEKAVRSTAFPKFQKDNFEVKFPFKLGS